jgi:DNA-binding NarL/FixJ family response regulator
MTRPAQVDESPQERRSGGAPHPRYLFATDAPTDGLRVLKYTPVEVLHASAQAAPCCDTCRNKKEGCRSLCEDIKKVLPNDHTGRGRREFTNELALDSHKKPVAMPSSPDFNRLLEVPHIFTLRQLQAIRLLHGGKSRAQTCQVMHVSNTRVSQLVRGALKRYDVHEARLRALMTLEMKRLGGSLFEDGQD